MKNLKLIIFTLFIFLFATNVNAETKLELTGANKVNYGSSVSYNVVLSTDEPIYGFQFDLDLDNNLTYLAHQSNINGLIVKVSNNKTRVIGYGKELNDGDNLLTIVFSVKELDKTTTVNAKLTDKLFTNGSNLTINDAELTSASTKVVVPVKEETTTTKGTTISNEKEKEPEKEVEKPEKEEEPEKEQEESKTSKIIKIIIIILLGALILYLLNKEEPSEEEIKEKKEKTKK